MKPVMFCTNSSGIPRRSHSSMKCARLQRGLAEQDPVVGDDPDRVAVEVGERAHERRAVELLELVQLARRRRSARSSVAHVVGRARVERDEVEQAVGVLRAAGAARARSHGGAARRAAACATIARTISSAWSSSSARWSTTPEVRACTSPPPSSSAVTSSPVAAFTSGGPPRKIVPCSRTITVSSLIAGTYAPPAVHEPITQRDLRDRALRTSSPG